MFRADAGAEVVDRFERLRIDVRLFEFDAELLLDRDDQLAVVKAALQGFNTLTQPGQMLTLPNRWDNDDWIADAGSNQGDDTRQPRDESPQFQLAADREAALAAGAL